MFTDAWRERPERFFLSPSPLDACERDLFAVMRQSLAGTPGPSRRSPPWSWDRPSPFAVLWMSDLPRLRSPAKYATFTAVSVRCVALDGGTLVGVRERPGRTPVWVTQAIAVVFLIALASVTAPILAFGSPSLRNDAIGYSLLGAVVVGLFALEMTRGLLGDRSKDVAGGAIEALLRAVEIPAGEAAEILALTPTPSELAPVAPTSVGG